MESTGGLDLYMDGMGKGWCNSRGIFVFFFFCFQSYPLGRGKSWTALAWLRASGVAGVIEGRSERDTITGRFIFQFSCSQSRFFILILAEFSVFISLCQK